MTESAQKLASVTLVLGLSFAIVGYFGPWVPHKTAALIVTGPELAELAKFFPQVQGGTVPVTRGLFLTPVIASATVLGLVASRLKVRPIARLIITGLAALFTLVALPPYEYLLDQDYRLHLILVIGGLVLVSLTLLAHRLPYRIWGFSVALASLAGAIPALRQYMLLRPLIVALYDAPIGLGWGLTICTVGFLLLLGSGIHAAVCPDRSIN